MRFALRRSFRFVRLGDRLVEPAGGREGAREIEVRLGVDGPQAKRDLQLPHGIADLPETGQHTTEILGGSLGFSDEQVAQLISDGIVEYRPAAG